MNAQEKLPEYSITDSVNSELSKKDELDIPVDFVDEEETDPYEGMSPAEMMKSDAASGFQSMNTSKASSPHATEDASRYSIKENDAFPMQSGIQEKQQTELSQSIQELMEGDDVMEIFLESINAAKKNGEHQAIITCQREGDVECKTLESILRSNSNVESFEGGSFNGKFGYIIHLKTETVDEKPQNEEEDDEDLAA